MLGKRLTAGALASPGSCLRTASDSSALRGTPSMSRSPTAHSSLRRKFRRQGRPRRSPQGTMAIYRRACRCPRRALHRQRRRYGAGQPSGADLAQECALFCGAGMARCPEYRPPPWPAAAVTSPMADVAGDWRLPNVRELPEPDRLRPSPSLGHTSGVSLHQRALGNSPTGRLLASSDILGVDR